jgi:hypothetical protein
LDCEDGRELLLAEDADQFVTATKTLLDNPAQAEQIARTARETLQVKWDWQVVVPRLESSYRELLARYRPDVSN